MDSSILEPQYTKNTNLSRFSDSKIKRLELQTIEPHECEKSRIQTNKQLNNQLNYLKNQFLKHLKNQRYSQNTIDMYKYKVNKFILFLLEYTNIKSIKELSRMHILDFKEYLVNQNIVPENVLCRIDIFCKFLLNQNILSYNPFNGFTVNHLKIKIRNPESLWEKIPGKENFKKDLVQLKTEFLQYLESACLARRTIIGYDGQLNYFFSYLLTQTKLSVISDITKEVIRGYQTYLSTKSEINEKLLSLTTQTRRLITVKNFCKFLVELEYIQNDVSSRVKLPKQSKSLPKGILTLNQLSKILSQPDITTPLGLRDRTILEILYSTGIRNKELRDLKLKDIDTSRNELRVIKGKGNKSRIVPTGEICSTFIDDYIRKARPCLVKFNPQTENLFVSKRSKLLNSYDLSKIVEKYCKKSGIKEKITPHSLRHTMATHMLKNKAPLRHIQLILGHSSINSTQIYTHVEISDLQKIHQQCHPRGKKQS